MQIEIELLKDFESGLDPEHPEQSKIPAKVLGYGEISTIFEIDTPATRDFACKRMPIFQSREEIEHYARIYNDYNNLLQKEIGINVPDFGFVWFAAADSKIVAFDLQRKLPAESIGNRAIHMMDTDNTRALFFCVLRELMKVWSFNQAHPARALGIDGQISNWSIAGFSAENPRITSDTKLLYIDTSTPMMKKNAVEQLDPELFLRSAPSFLRWLIRWLFLEGVMTRYYDARLVTIDLIANLYKEQRPELVPLLVAAANDFYRTEGSKLDLAPFTGKDVSAYYREDKTIWIVFLALRRFDRWLHKHILRKPYVYILPGKIRR
ncbi:MAG: DUF6206 family protein [Smithellaceae bacterium]